jgi:hypothetical protein
LAEVVLQEFISLILTGEIFNIKSKALTDPGSFIYRLKFERLTASFSPNFKFKVCQKKKINQAKITK